MHISCHIIRKKNKLIPYVSLIGPSASQVPAVSEWPLARPAVLLRTHIEAVRGAQTRAGS